MIILITLKIERPKKLQRKSKEVKQKNNISGYKSI